MWYGQMTQELDTLYDEYYDIFGVEPDGYMELEYGKSSYKEYVSDIKKAIKEKKELPKIAK